MSSVMTENELRTYLRGIRDRVRVTKVVATRAVKGRLGDSFAGFSAAWDSVQDDGGGRGAELINTMGEPVASQGMSLQDARIAHLFLALTADIAATEAAMAGGNISPEDGENRIRVYKNNYSKLVRQVFSKPDDEEVGEVIENVSGRGND